MHGERVAAHRQRQSLHQISCCSLPIRRANPALPWHTRPFPNACYVLAGTLIVEDQARAKRRALKTAQAFTESVDEARREGGGSEPTVVILTRPGAPGNATSKPIEGGQPEPGCAGARGA